MTNRISGDFNLDVVEAFRSAYADQLVTPQDQDTDEYTGLPSDTVSNTSPWIAHTGLWRYPSGKGPESDLKQPFDPKDYYDDEDDEDELSEEEVETLVEDLLDILGSEDDD